jgi:hypothetical protein
MRTAIAPHELLPEGLYLETLGIETGRVGISAASGTSPQRPWVPSLWAPLLPRLLASPTPRLQGVPRAEPSC